LLLLAREGVSLYKTVNLRDNHVPLLRLIFKGQFQ